MAPEPDSLRAVQFKLMRYAAILIAFVLSGCATTGERPAPLTQADIVQMAQAGEPAGKIIERLWATNSVIFLSATEILELNRQGVQPEVLDWLQREQVLELRRRDAFDYWSYNSPFSRCVGWSGRRYPQPFRGPYWPYWPYC